MKNKRIVKISSLLVTVVMLLCCMAPPAFAQDGDTASTASTTQAEQTDTVSTAATGAGWVQMAPMHEARYTFQTVVADGKIYAVGGSNSSGCLSSIEEYDPLTNVWTTKAAMTTPRAKFQVKVVNGKVYAIGGFNSSSQNLSSVEEYDPLTNVWTTKASMHTGRNDFQAIVNNGKIYVIGGISDGDTISSVEEYDPNLNTWTTKASLNMQRSNFQTEVINGKIYAIGGHYFDGYKVCLCPLEEYNLENNLWTTQASMIEPRYHFQTNVIGDNIYAIGGIATQTSKIISSVENCQIGTGSWINQASMSSSRRDLQSIVVDGKIYAIGGQNESEYLSSMEEYDITTGTWIAKEPMSTPRCCFYVEIVNGIIYAIGGENSTGALSSVEAYAVEQPSLTITPSSDKVTVGDSFTATVAIHNVANICAEDMKLTYDTNLFEYVGSEPLTGLTICTEDKATPGALRFVVASQGIANAATGDKDLIKLTFKAKAPGTGKVDITKGRIADNVSLETDVAEENCGEATITVETSKDVNRSGEVTLLDLGIDAGYYGVNAADTDTTKYDTDAVPDGVIDGKDLNAITVDMLANKNYPLNN